MSLETIGAELAQHIDVAGRVAKELAGSIDRLGQLVAETVRAGGKLLICGNGGSAADAQHLAAEYVVKLARERRPLPAIALTTDASILTAVSNDYGFERVFERQVRALGRRGDLLLLQSTSGTSPNLLSAAAAARAMGLGSAALLARDGGPLAKRVDLAIVVPTDSTERAQEMHLTIGHIVCGLVERALDEASPASARRAP